MSGSALTAAERTCAHAFTAARARIGPVDARVLLSNVLGRDAAYWIAHPERKLTAEQHARLCDWVERRAGGEPVAYITGVREFYGRSFGVDRHVLIPRPETELLVELALAHLPKNEVCQVLDLGTGSGCVAVSIALERPYTHVTAVDFSTLALEQARTNAQSLGVHNVRFYVSDWFSALGDARFDLIVANPPYVAETDPHLERGDLRFEPKAALTAGADGLAALRAIIAASRDHLASGARLYVEHGYDQTARCKALFVANGYAAVSSYRDLAGTERVAGGSIASAG